MRSTEKYLCMLISVGCTDGAFQLVPSYDDGYLQSGFFFFPFFYKCFGSTACWLYETDLANQDFGCFKK